MYDIQRFSHIVRRSFRAFPASIREVGPCIFLWHLTVQINQLAAGSDFRSLAIVIHELAFDYHIVPDLYLIFCREFHASEIIAAIDFKLGRCSSIVGNVVGIIAKACAELAQLGNLTFHIHVSVRIGSRSDYRKSLGNVVRRILRAFSNLGRTSLARLRYEYCFVVELVADLDGGLPVLRGIRKSSDRNGNCIVRCFAAGRFKCQPVHAVHDGPVPVGCHGERCRAPVLSHFQGLGTYRYGRNRRVFVVFAAAAIE